MEAKTEKAHYKIGITFRGTQRDKLVLPICQELLKHGFNKNDVFYDEWHRDEWSGKESFIDIYGNRCDFVVVLLSDDYDKGYWTHDVEWTAVQKLIRNFETNENILILVMPGVNVYKSIYGENPKNADDIEPRQYYIEGKEPDVIVRRIVAIYEDIFEEPKARTHSIKNDVDHKEVDKYLSVTFDRADELIAILHELDGVYDAIPFNWIEYGYWLGGAYERVGNFDKSAKIASVILDYIQNDRRRLLNKATAFNDIRFTIGLAYSLAIAKNDNIDIRRGYLKRAEDVYEDDFETKINNSPLTEIEKYILKGMYYSDYGAFRINKGQFLKEHHEPGVDAEFEDALEQHKKGVKVREKYLELATSEYEKKDAKSRLLQSKSNVANVLYHMGRYDEAIEDHKKVMAESDRSARIYVKSEIYIMGSYIGKWTDKGYIDTTEEKEFLYYLNDSKKLAEGSDSLTDDVVKKENEYHSLKNSHGNTDNKDENK